MSNIMEMNLYFNFYKKLIIYNNNINYYCIKNEPQYYQNIK